MTTNFPIILVSFVLVSLWIFSTMSPVFAYDPPISNNFMPAYCPLRSDGSKDPSCLYIPKSQCTHFVSKQGSDNNSGTEA